VRVGGVGRAGAGVVCGAGKEEGAEVRKLRALCVGVNHDPNAKHAADDAVMVARALWGAGYEADVRDCSRRGNWTLGPAYDVVYYACECVVAGGAPLLFLNDPTYPSPWLSPEFILPGNALTIFDCCHVGSFLHSDPYGFCHLALCAGKQKTMNRVHAGSFFAHALTTYLPLVGALPTDKAGLDVFAARLQREVDALHRANQVAYEVQEVTTGWL
jgi:hypothetical protein